MRVQSGLSALRVNGGNISTGGGIAVGIVVSYVGKYQVAFGSCVQIEKRDRYLKRGVAYPVRSTVKVLNVARTGCLKKNLRKRLAACGDYERVGMGEGVMTVRVSRRWRVSIIRDW